MTLYKNYISITKYKMYKKLQKYKNVQKFNKLYKEHIIIYHNIS